ncbi:glycosyltransferase family 1 protein [Gloeocapsa sp. PCC 73106]|uniref:glycosyltransferase family 4 protein n=1 Tax=Gloeocapsa sp. PCC 73106 TaxID=102232 RepID=UPI0002ACD5CE|nr:glycosyltransferase family 1 protein [Gloeocapsa sp. PCC 73106]ELR96682.1 glycosyltransferase [Gloeocapsa sp. PCC 73106]
MLKVAIDVTPLRAKPSGIGVYTYNLIQALIKLQTSEDFSLSLAYQPSFKKWLRGDISFAEEAKFNLNTYSLPLPVTVASLLSRFPNPILPYLESCLNSPALLHGTDHFVYPCRRSKNILTIHDLTFLKYPQYVSSIVKTYYSRIKKCLTWSDLIITFSENTKQEISYYFNVNPEKIVITPQASRFFEVNSVSYHFDYPYLLFVSTLEPRKNIINLIKAYNYIKEKYQVPHHLVLIGQKGWSYKGILEAINTSPYVETIHHLDYLSDQLVAWFYSKAEAFVYPSYYEGFGLPILEAMTLGAPVITSNTSSLPEVAGDCALLINPQDYLELGEAMIRIISDRQLRQELVKKGKARSKLYSWEKTAQATLEAYRILS